MESIMILFSMKLKNTKKMREDKSAIEEGIEKVVQLVEKQLEAGIIIGVLDKLGIIK